MRKINVRLVTEKIRKICVLISLVCIFQEISLSP